MGLSKEQTVKLQLTLILACLNGCFLLLNLLIIKQSVKAGDVSGLYWSCIGLFSVVALVIALLFVLENHRKIIAKKRMNDLETGKILRSYQ